MVKGIHLTLFMGPGIAVPVPSNILDSLTNVQVTSGKDQSGFQLTFSIGKKISIFNSLLIAGFFDPIVTRVILMVTINGIPNVIIDGLVTNHEMNPSETAGGSTLTLTGEDLSVAMDLIQNIKPFPAMPDFARVNLILAPYAALGIAPVVVPPLTTIVQSPTDGYEVQTNTTDKVYLKALARRNGYVFYVQPSIIPGQSIAYFGPDISIPFPQSALSVNLDAHSNVETLSFSLDGLAKKIRVYMINDPATERIPIPVPLPNISPLRPPLGARPSPAVKLEYANNAAGLGMDEAVRDIVSFMMGDSNAGVSGTGSLDVMRYGKILRSRMLVGVRGAGLVYDGLYYVDTVTHTIKPGEYKQNFTLSRDGLISNVPLVPV